MSELQTVRIGLNDLYELAYNIAQEFEKLVILCEIDVLEPVINKVIHVLEILENHVQRIENLESEITTLKNNNFRLYSEKIVSDQEKTKLKQIYEENEESLLEEVGSLKSHVSALKSENELLRSRVAEKKDKHSKPEDKSDEAVEKESECIKRMKNLLKQKEKQLQKNVSTINFLNLRIQELLQMNESLHLKNQVARKDISKLIVEKNDAKNELKLYKRENMLLTETIQEFLQSSLQESSERSTKTSLTEDLSCHLEQGLTLQEKIKNLKAELQNFKARSKHVRHETKASKLSFNKNKKPLSKIHQLFHLFLGVSSLSEFYWF